MQRAPRHLVLVDPAERHPLCLGASTLYYRRLSLGALAAIERQQAVLAPGGPGEPPRHLLPPAALEAAVLAQVLVGWRGVLGPRDGREVDFTPQAVAALPAAARRLVIRRARLLHPPQGERT